jgi:hypothetical protein
MFARTCEFGDQVDKLIADQLFLLVNLLPLQEKLLCEEDLLTLSKAMEHGRDLKMANLKKI